jgi:diguanylate cyclase (GGDEF)-like protein
MSEISPQIQYDTFVGPLPKETYDEVTSQFNLFRQDRLVEFAARAMYGQRKARAHEAELQSQITQSEVDRLTGVYRRDVVYNQLQNMICGLEMKRRGSDTDEDLAVIVFDIEEFKAINDESWDKGDEALKVVGNGLLNTARSSKGDVPGRIGGDEFLLILPYNKNDTAKEKLLESIEDRIRNVMPIRFPNLPSLRWHHAFYQSGDTAESLIDRAYPKGENKQLCRSHSQSEEQYTQNRNRFLGNSRQSALRLLKEA